MIEQPDHSQHRRQTHAAESNPGEQDAAHVRIARLERCARITSVVRYSLALNVLDFTHVSPPAEASARRAATPAVFSLATRMPLIALRRSPSRRRWRQPSRA